MNATHTIAARLDELSRRHNRGLAFDAALKASLGLVFSLLTFGVVYWLGWCVGFFFAPYLSLQAWQFGLLVAAVFVAVATWSAWRNVNPLAGLQPMSEKELMTMLVSEAAGLGCLSPRHASAGAAVVLMGGPASLLRAVATRTARIRRGHALMEDAASLLVASEESCLARRVRQLNAAVLLRRLGLIKVISHDESAALTVTDKGMRLLSGAKGKAGKRPAKRDQWKPNRAEADTPAAPGPASDETL